LSNCDLRNIMLCCTSFMLLSEAIPSMQGSFCAFVCYGQRLPRH